MLQDNAHTATNRGVTQAAANAADAERSVGAVEGVEQGCRGWVELDSRYWHVNDLGVSARIEVHRITGGIPGGNDEATELVQTHELHYEAEAGERLDEPSSPAEALTDGNCRILLGGEDGFEAGAYYRLKLTPRDNPDQARKFVILPAVVADDDVTSVPEGTPAADLEQRRAIADDTTGQRSAPLTLATTVDRYMRVPDGSPSSAAQWTTTPFVMPCAEATQPHQIDLRWIHFFNPRDFIYDHLLDLEGGGVNDPADRGGATNKGITIATWQRFSQTLFGIAGTVETLRNITDDQVYEITLAGYWRQFWCDRINQHDIAIQYLDTCFNGGGVNVLQRAINRVANAQGKQNWTTTVDSSMGFNTLKQANRIIECGHTRDFYVAYREERIARFHRIVANNPSQQRFIRGWINRANDFDAF